MAADETFNYVIEVDDLGSKQVQKFARNADGTFKKVEKSIKRNMTDAIANFARSAGTAFKRVATSAVGAFKTISRSVFSLKGALAGLALGVIAYKIKGMTDEWEGLSKVQEQAESTMMAAMKSMGRYSDEFYKATLATAAGIQAVTTFGDEAILTGAKFLMTYEGISNDVMPRVMETMADVAALMGGDFKSAANMLGKASMGMIGELRRVGITVDADTFKIKGFLGVLEAIEAQVKGQAKALRDTKAGGLEAFGNVVGDIKEKFGLFVSTIKEKLSKDVFPIIEKIDKKLSELKESGKLEEWATKAADAIKSAFKTAIEWIKDFWEWVKKAYNKLKDIQSEVTKAASGFQQLRLDALNATIAAQNLVISSGQVARGNIKTGEVQYMSQEQSAIKTGLQSSITGLENKITSIANEQASSNSTFAAVEDFASQAYDWFSNPNDEYDLMKATYSQYGAAGATSEKESTVNINVSPGVAETTTGASELARQIERQIEIMKARGL
jgi:hypothetical protein